MTLAALVATLLVVPSFFAWSAVHELSHYIAARHLRALPPSHRRTYRRLVGLPLPNH